MKDSDRGEHDSDKPTGAETHTATYTNFIGKKKKKKMEKRKNTLPQTHLHANHVRIRADRVTHTIFLRIQPGSGAENVTRGRRNKN